LTESRNKNPCLENKQSNCDLDNSLRESIDSLNKKTAIKTIFTKENEKSMGCMYNEYKAGTRYKNKRQKVKLLNSNESISEEEHSNDLLESATNQRYLKQNNTIFYGNLRNSMVEDKHFNRNNINSQNERFSYCKFQSYKDKQSHDYSHIKNTLNKLNFSTNVKIKDDLEDNIQKIVSNASTAANSIKSLNKIDVKTTYTNKKSENELKESVNRMNKIGKIKSILNNKHNFSFHQLSNLDFDINKVLEKSRASIPKNYQ